jgi:hypothetical protein
LSVLASGGASIVVGGKTVGGWRWRRLRSVSRPPNVGSKPRQAIQPGGKYATAVTAGIALELLHAARTAVRGHCHPPVYCGQYKQSADVNCVMRSASHGSQQPGLILQRNEYAPEFTADKTTRIAHATGCCQWRAEALEDGVRQLDGASLRSLQPRSRRQQAGRDPATARLRTGALTPPQTDPDVAESLKSRHSGPQECRPGIALSCAGASRRAGWCSRTSGVRRAAVQQQPDQNTCRYIRYGVLRIEARAHQGTHWH